MESNQSRASLFKYSKSIAKIVIFLALRLASWVPVYRDSNIYKIRGVGSYRDC